MKKNVLFKIIPIAVLFVAVVACVVFLFVDARQTPESITNDYLSACYKDFDAQKIKTVLNEDVATKQIEDTGMTFDQHIESMQLILDGQKDELAKEKATISWEITGEKELSGKELEEMKEFYKSNFNLELTNCTVVTVDSVKLVEQKEEERAEFEVYVMEIDSKLSIDRMAASY